MYYFSTQACRLLCSSKQSLEQLVNISSESQRLNAPQLQRLLADYSYASNSQSLRYFVTFHLFRLHVRSLKSVVTLMKCRIDMNKSK